MFFPVRRLMEWVTFPSDLCKDLPCTPPQVCVIDPSTQRPTCGCVQSCEDRMEQVCGTDGNLYSNRCKLDLHACHSGRNIKVQNEGPCQGTDPYLDTGYSQSNQATITNYLSESSFISEKSVSTHLPILRSDSLNEIHQTIQILGTEHMYQMS